MKILKAFIHSNLFISIAALLLTVETQIQLGLQPQWHPYLFLIFFATIFEYNVHRLFTILFFPQSLDSPKHQWVKENKLFFYLVVSFSVIGFLIALFQAKFSVLLALSPLALLTVFYSIPIANSHKGIFRLREIPYLKIFLIAIVWSVVTVLLPVIYHNAETNFINFICIILERFLFVFAITIPFDIRDMEEDTASSLKTLPLQLGKKKAEMLSQWAMYGFMLLSVIHYSLSSQMFIAIAMLVSGISTLYFIQNKNLQKSPYYFYGILDGTMLLQAVLVIVAYFLK